MMQKKKVIVVGGGMAGSSATFYLQKWVKEKGLPIETLLIE